MIKTHFQIKIVFSNKYKLDLVLSVLNSKNHTQSVVCVVKIFYIECRLTYDAMIIKTPHIY
jgi:hypothetical protein